MRVAALTLALLAAGASAAPPERGLAALRDPARLVQMGREADMRGEARQAMALYDLAISADPKNVPALTFAGENALRRGDGADAYAYFSGLAQVDPKSATAQLGLGAALVLRLQPADALAALAKADTLGAPRPRVASQRGLAYDIAGDFRSAQVAYGSVLAAEPDNIEAARRLALSLALSGSRPAALQVLRRFETDSARSVPLRQTMSMVYALTGDPAMADEIAASFLTAEQAKGMSGFFATLPGLSTRDRTIAAIFGRLPDSKEAVAPTRPIATSVSATPVIKVAAAPPSSPKRIWVQVANIGAAARVRDGWAAIVKTGGGAPDLRDPRVERSAAGNRLLIGPFGTRDQANAAALRLKARGVDGFPVTTPAGTRVTGLDGETG